MKDQIEEDQIEYSLLENALLITNDIVKKTRSD
jgi:hypothetical protein